jgi:OmpA-OmpF porin, OOP family
MRTVSLCFCFLIIFLHVYSQNLIKNPSFENHTDCPSDLDQLYFCKDWYNPTDASPDYFNRCYDDLTVKYFGRGNVGVPVNNGGYQLARTGNAYVGIINFWDESFSYREFIATSFIRPLISGQRYRISFYVSLSDSSEYFNNTFCVCMNQDSLLPKIFAKSKQYNMWHCKNPVIITKSEIQNDTSNWHLVTADYIAEGGEKYFILGLCKEAFSKKAWRKVKNKQKTGWKGYFFAYYYIDDVSVEEVR